VLVLGLGIHAGRGFVCSVEGGGRGDGSCKWGVRVRCYLCGDVQLFSHSKGENGVDSAAGRGAARTPLAQ
jgi:hypothetical protein